MSSQSKLRITWIKSAIGHNQRQKATVKALGLRHLNHFVFHDDTPSIRGMLHVVDHLIQIETVSEEEMAGIEAEAKAEAAARADASAKALAAARAARVEAKTKRTLSGGREAAAMPASSGQQQAEPAAGAPEAVTSAPEDAADLIRAKESPRAAVAAEAAAETAAAPGPSRRRTTGKAAEPGSAKAGKSKTESVPRAKTSTARPKTSAESAEPAAAKKTTSRTKEEA